MAIPYPEGAVFFERSVLTNSHSAHYQATRESDFYSHFMIEYLWNVEADHGSKNANSWDGHSHPRSGYGIVKGSNWGTHYGNWKNLPISYGPSEGNIRRRVQHNLCQNGNRFKNHEKGDAAESWFMTLPMPKKDERWVWIDMLACIRAIYIPVSFYASKDYPHLSKWVQLNFTHGGTTQVWRGGNTFDGHVMDRTSGLQVWRDFTVGFDFTGLVNLLSCPVEFRKVNAYSAKFVKIVPRNNIKTVSVSASYSDAYDFDWLKITRAHSGLDIKYGEADKGSWLADFMKNAVTFGLGFIPVVGPLFSVAFSLAWTAVGDPDNFLHDLSLWAPIVKTPEFIADIKKNSSEIKPLVHERWWNRSGVAGLLSDGGEKQEDAIPVIEATPYFKEAQAALDESGTNPAKYEKEKDDPEGPGEVLVEVAEGAELEDNPQQKSAEQ